MDEFETRITQLLARYPKITVTRMLEELQKAPAVLRLSYVADVESEALVERRLEVLKAHIMSEWADLNCCYELVVEPEIYWRLGGPPARPRGEDR